MVGGPDITDDRDGCVYLLNLEELVLIDAGAGWSADNILKNIKQFGFNTEQISRILLTHCHIDHIGGAPEIRKRSGARLYIHDLDAEPVEKGDPVLTAANWYQTAFPPTPVDVKFTLQEEIIEIGQEQVVCLHTPGHTPGSISIYLDRDGKRVLFGQDLHGPLLKEFGSRLEDYDRSTKKLLALEADILCEGHFGIYETKKAVRDYISSCRRNYGLPPT